MSMTEHENMTEKMTPAETLRLAYAGVRVQFTWFGVRKALTNGQTSEIADDFDADRKMLSASKKLIDTKHPAYRPLAKIKRGITGYFKHSTVPFPEPGVRLLPMDKLEAFEKFMDEQREAMREAAEDLQDSYDQVRDKARQDLGQLFDDSDYPTDIASQFSVSNNVENLAPPDWLLSVNSKYYDREMRRIQSMFNDAVDLAEQAFAAELAKLVDNLRDRMTPGEDGMPKVFGDGCVLKLQAFVARFRELSVKSNDDLERLVTECDNLTRGVSAEQFRGIPELRAHLVEKLGEVQGEMEKTLQVAPRRKIVRRGNG